MSDGMSDGLLAQQLLDLAIDPILRNSVYDRLGEYCHQCRNRLNSLKLSLFLAMRQSPGLCPGAWNSIEHQYLELERVVERMQVICRPMTLSRVTIALELLLEDRRVEWTRLIGAVGGELEWIPPRSRSIANFDVDRMGQALDALVRWRAADFAPDRLARIRWRVESGTAHFSWEEVDKTQIRPAIEGTTWTLPLIARIAEAHGGLYRLTGNRDSTWQLELAWPARTGTP